MHKRLRLLTIPSLILAMAACNGAASGAGGAGGEGGAGSAVSSTVSSSDFSSRATDVHRRFFEQEVHHMLLQACGSCHAEGNSGGPSFLLSSARGTYDYFHYYNSGALVAPPHKNLLLNKGIHEGPALDSMQFAVIVNWLELEYPNIIYTPPLLNMFKELTKVMSCIAQDREGFDASVSQIFMTPTDGDCTCATCHAAAEAKGSGGQIVFDPDADATFTAMQKFPGVMTLVQPEVGDTGIFYGLKPSHRIASKGTDPTPQSQGMPNPGCSCQTALSLKMNGVINVADPTYCHPAYALPVALKDGIDALVTTTLSSIANTTCPAAMP